MPRYAISRLDLYRPRMWRPIGLAGGPFLENMAGVFGRGAALLVVQSVQFSGMEWTGLRTLRRLSTREGT